MNCKQDDLAIKVQSTEGAWIEVGAVVKVISFQGEKVGLLANGRLGHRGPRWLVEYNGSTVNPITGRNWTALDSQLRPIRDSDGEDETLQWAPVPTKETA